jgi:hypothetical protein
MRLLGALRKGLIFVLILGTFRKLRRLHVYEHTIASYFVLSQRRSAQKSHTISEHAYIWTCSRMQNEILWFWGEQSFNDSFESQFEGVKAAFLQRLFRESRRE